jgi:hypothetical protein
MSVYVIEMKLIKRFLYHTLNVPVSTSRFAFNSCTRDDITNRNAPLLLLSLGEPLACSVDSKFQALRRHCAERSTGRCLVPPKAASGAVVVSSGGM